MSPADLYVALWVLSQSTLSAPYGAEVCLNGGTPPLCSIQISSGNLPLFGSLYDGDYPLPPAQGFPDWFFSYRDRTSHDGNLSGDYREFSGPTPDSVSPSIFTFSADRSPTQSNRSDICYDKIF